MGATYWQYWGKAKPLEAAVRYHLLAYHCLDVAAVGDVLLQRLGLALDGIAAELGLSATQLRALLVFFLVLHDLGKFARVFQLLAKDLSPDLVAGKVGQRCYTQRHDTLGCLLWQQALVSQLPPGLLADPANGYWADWIKIVTGHHGMPPKDERSSLSIEDFFVDEDIDVATRFVADVAGLLLPVQLPAPTRQQHQALQRHSWLLAGLAVLADWLGSDQQHFPYHDRPTHSLADYWQQVAQPAAARAVAAAGVGAHAVAPFPGAAHLTRLFHYLHEPTPLQRHAASVQLGSGPQLFLLEDVTGAGKTEAALILAHRLMAQGLAHGFYFGLPTMATANQMYQRVGNVYRGFYQEGERPSIMLAHGARDLIADFQQSIQPRDRGYAQDEPSATLQCNAWLADNRKKALLADIGVGVDRPGTAGCVAGTASGAAAAGIGAQGADH
ncbi:CRISPR-associated endonuclease/helicase Cas3 [Andreprevotia sp. IGB-42]|uniref:CRISPR-associated endonuclease Cas3'' n=1 Tax=Andreprevotia sp. IGB-42 TaxID=2497473 RepID=UPI00135C4093|nr:CRISPR-associated endonuclease Cas3'' [Andreprevotia sp. IGB-42]KAF0814004.1 CRISPR-associated endonuclease/helicase Cas3 [Andreprevotia sp. IGB-42]